MTKKFIVLILVIFLLGLAIAAPKKVDTLRDGFGLFGVDGKLITVDNKWFFKLDSDLEDDQGIIKAGMEVELLPASTLEKIIASAESHKERGYRLWGKVTAYKGKNYIFSNYFLPITEIKKADSEKQAGKAAAINDPNDTLAVPEELAAKLSARKVITTEELKQGLEIKTDSILADRTGFLEQRADGQMMFTLDGLGRNFPRISIRLMPCYFLENAEEKTAEEPDKLRFKIAGIVTRYKSENYLLLHRIVRIYNNGNFPG
jgi:hypothetical protein